MVVGSGIAGLTAARLLAMHGAKVLVLEQAARPGGLLARFSRRGVPFDVGFHFTGGFTPDGHGILDEMLRVLGVREAIKPVPYPAVASHHLMIPSAGVEYTAPSGFPAFPAALARDFPADRAGIEHFFVRFQRVVDGTPTLRLAEFDHAPTPLDEDVMSLQSVLDQTIRSPVLQTIISGFCMCYGCRPDEISFANHCRMTHGLHQSLARVENGGQAFVDALLAALSAQGVEVRCGTGIAALEDVHDRQVRRFRLTDGTEITADACILTMHPWHILELLRTAGVSKAFQSRVTDFELSPGFFSLFGVLKKGSAGKSDVPVVSILPETDLNRMLTCRTPTPTDEPLVLFRNREQATDGPVDAVTILEVSFAEWLKPWADSSFGRRPPGYEQYKRERIASILRRVTACIPGFRDDFGLYGSSSMLTFRDRLRLPGGAAYGIRQKIGQFNLVGRLPLSNLHAVGQSAILPGIIGAMTSAFIVCRGIMGKDRFHALLEKGRGS